MNIEFLILNLIIFFAYPLGLVIKKISREDYTKFLSILTKIFYVLILTYVLYSIEGYLVLISLFIILFLLKFKVELLAFTLPILSYYSTTFYVFVPFMLMLGLKNSSIKWTSLYLVSALLMSLL